MNFRSRIPGVQHPLFVELDTGRTRRCRAGGDDDVSTADVDLVASYRVLDQHGVLVDKPAVTGVELDAVADQLRADNVLLLVNDVPGAR